MLIEIFAVIFAITYLILAVRQNILCWYAAFFSTAIYTFLYWDVSLYMESILNIYYLLMAIYGWINWNNKKNEMTKLVDDLFEELKNLNFNVFLQDERLSSESAKKIMHEQNIKTGKNKEHIDLIASTIILQSFLDKGSF